jgi:hypothetical protein
MSIFFENILFSTKSGMCQKLYIPRKYVYGITKIWYIFFDLKGDEHKWVS